MRILPAEDFYCFEVADYQGKSFTFIVLTHNNVDSIEQNLETILSQDYEDFRVCYLDLASSDGTAEILRERVGEKVNLVECQKDYELYEAYYNIVLNCPDDQVIVHLYGTDWLAHNDVLSCLSHSYTNPDVWLAYGQYLDYPSYQKGVHNPKPKKTLYKKRVQRAPWVMAPLKTFYAGLFKKLHVEAGFFLSIENENALLMPMVELAKAHVRFIPNVLFIHNKNSGRVRKSRRLAFMADQVEKTLSKKMVDLMILSENTPQDLEKCLKSCQSKLKGVADIHVIYRFIEKTYLGYEKVKRKFPKVHFAHPLEYGEETFKQTVIQSLWGSKGSAPYVLLSTDQVKVTDPIFLPTCVKAMRKAHAYGFFFPLGKEGKGPIRQGIYYWNIRNQTAAALQMGLYRRLDLEQDLKALQFGSLQELMERWAGQAAGDRLGLCFEEAKAG
ncbi:glycosyltransferase family A protein [Candidatus Neptunochlamydia vexilliferae]|nr:glycosyltransferase family A protein [Candidatus Neptunochlamydia vexilliferae]